MPDTIAIEILKTLRTRKGCTLYELAGTLPEVYAHADEPSDYFLFEPLTRLMKWGLVQAFLGDQLIEVENVLEVVPYNKRRTMRYYLSPAAVAMEHNLGFSFTGAPRSIFGDDTSDAAWPDVFVLMPFSENLRPIYEDHIKKIVVACGFTVDRADNFFSAGAIIQQIWSAISSATIVIADCTGRNPNVFYEIGLAHAVGKDTILISQSIDDVPFDLRHLRVIQYTYTPPGMKTFEQRLSAFLGGMRSGGEKAKRRPTKGLKRTPDGAA